MAGVHPVPKYLGMSSIAQMYWCHQFFIFKSLRNEGEFRQLAGLLANVPGGIVHVPPVGTDESVTLLPSVLKDMRLEDFKSVLAHFGYQPSVENWKASAKEHELSGTCRHWILGARSVLFLYSLDASPDPLTNDQYDLWRADAPILTLWEDGTISILGNEPEILPVDRDLEGSSESEAMRAGRHAEVDIAERYDSAQGLFSWKSYYIVGIPDGLTAAFAYEFKSSRTDMLRRFQRSVAESQARLYAYFFGRSAIRVQLHSRESGDVLTIEKPLDLATAEQDLDDADRLLRGESDPVLPKAWKCKQCEFRDECSIRQEQLRMF